MPIDPPVQLAEHLAELDTLRTRFDPAAAATKARLLRALCTGRVDDAGTVQHLHAEACFHRAFPASLGVWRAARALARTIAGRVAALRPAQRTALGDSGIAGSVTRNVLSAAAARWIAARFPAQADVDWLLLDDPAALLPVLAPILQQLEDEVLPTGRTALARWLQLAREGAPPGEIAWLVRHAPPQGAAGAAWDRAWDTATVPVRWRLADTAAASTLNAWRRPVAVRASLRKLSADPHAAIVTPLPAIERLSRRDARALRDVWRAALLARTRTVFQAEHGNLDECWVADLGHGLALAAIGVPPRRRSPLEVNYGHLLLANGLPIGYGGFTALFRQVNTGINVFPEFRGSEAPFAWEQALRAMHALTGCGRVVINPYQFGAGNDEALASGAFWFYYRLGFRPVEPAVRALAQQEAARLADDRRYRVPLRTLRRLAQGDLHLDLAGDAGDTFFEESWLDGIAAGITASIAAERAPDRPTALRRKCARLATWLDIDLAACTADVRWGLAQAAPIVDQVPDLAAWPAAERRALGAMCVARWAPVERAFVAQAAAADRFRIALAAVARARAGAEVAA